MKLIKIASISKTDIDIKDIQRGDYIEYYGGGRGLIYKGNVVRIENGTPILKFTRNTQAFSVRIEPLEENINPPGFIRKFAF